MSVRATVVVCLALSGALILATASHAQAPAYRIAFQSDRSGDASDLWLVDSDGTNEQALTHTPTPEAAPSWSPDGKTIVYSCAPADNWEVCKIDVATGVWSQLTHTSKAEFDPRYTSDGTQIVLESYTSDSKADIAIVPAVGGVPVALASTPAADDQDPAPEPGGSQIAFASSGKIAISTPAPQAAVTFVPGGSGSDSDPSFSSANEVVFAGRQGGIAVAGPPDASGKRSTRQLTARGGCIIRAGRIVRCKKIATRAAAAPRSAAAGVVADLEPGWTATGTDILFARLGATDRGTRIYTMSGDGSGKRALTRGGDYDDGEPAAGPPGSGGPLGRMLRILVRPAIGACSTINGTRGNNRLKGTAGQNCMFGLGGRDSLSGGGGDDKLTGAGGRDALYGEAGQDRFYATDGEKDYVSGGTGADEARIDDGMDTHSSTVVH